MSKPTKTVTWPELSAMQDPDIGMGVFLNAQKGNVAGVKKVVGSPKFQELVDAFEASTIPDKFASPARTKAKEKLVKEYKVLLGFAKGIGSAKDIKAATISIQAAITELTNPDLK